MPKTKNNNNKIEELERIIGTGLNPFSKYFAKDKEFQVKAILVWHDRHSRLAARQVEERVEEEWMAFDKMIDETFCPSASAKLARANLGMKFTNYKLEKLLAKLKGKIDEKKN